METSMDTSNAATEDLSGALYNLQIDDLMKWHLYIGYSWKDRETVKELHALLQSKGLKCKLRSSLDMEEQSQADNIRQGIIFSHKCLLYISPNYLEDPNSQLELKEAERKLQLLGKKSVFGIVKYNVKKEQLRAYEQFQLIFVKDGQTVPGCLTLNWDAILHDYELKSGLSLVPKENIGVGVAYTYFFSYLRIVVPGFREEMFKEIRRSAAFKEPNDKKFFVKKMLIIIPKTLLSPLKLADDPSIRRTIHAIKQCYHRAGKENREYTLPIYELTDQEYGNVYYFVTDIPSCLYAIREAYDFKPDIRDDVNVTRNEFVLTLKALLNDTTHLSDFKDQWELLLWPDVDYEKNPMKLSEFVCQQIKSKGLAESFAVIPIQPIDTKIDTKFTPEPSDCANPKRKRHFEFAGGIEAYPMYSERPRYDLKNSPRGYCIIINNYRFLRDLEERKGAEIETQNLEKLFTALKFEVVIKRNLGREQMLSILKEYRDKDHSKRDAFVCCLLSHGSKGRIFGTGGMKDSISVVKLMELFHDDDDDDDDDKHGLKKKPKLFFIGTCQSKESVTEDEKPDTILESISVTPMPLAAGQGVSSESSDTQTDAAPEERSENDVRDLIPSTVDFIVSYACLPNTEALRDENKGGYYVQALCKHLTQDLEIDVALRYVNQEVRELWDKYKKDGGKEFSKPNPFHVIMPPQKFLFLNSI